VRPDGDRPLTFPGDQPLALPSEKVIHDAVRYIRDRRRSTHPQRVGFLHPLPRR
jgi:hypothetical protein